MKWAITLLFVGLACNAANYYVSKSGNDSTGNGSSGNPWLTIMKANPSATSAGDVVHIVGPGTWDETVQPTHSGSAGNLITWKWENGAISRYVYLNGLSYVRILSAEIVNTNTAFASTGIEAHSATGIEVEDCYIHDVQGGGVNLDSTFTCNYCVVRSNTIARTGEYNGTQNDGAAGVYVYGHHNLVEYNDISRVSDFFSSLGASNILRNNFLHDVRDSYYSSSSPHVDLVEMTSGNGPTNNLHNVFERNWSESNLVANGHGLLVRNTTAFTNTALIYRMNVVNGLGSYGWIAGSGGDQNDCTHLKFYNNTFAYANQSNEAQDSCWSIEAAIAGHSTGSSVINNIAFMCNTNSRIHDTGAYRPADFTPDYDLMLGGTFGIAETHGKTNNPVFVSSSDLHLQVSSPAVGMATYQTTTANSGSSSTSLTLSDGYCFSDGFGIADGDWVKISTNNPVQITAIIQESGTATISSALSWSNGSQVVLVGTPDVGALPYKASYAITATISNAGNNYTVTADTNLVRQVVFYENGIPKAPVFGPFTYTSGGGAVTATAFPLYAQTTLGVQATQGNPVLSTLGTGTVILTNGKLIFGQ